MVIVGSSFGRRPGGGSSASAAVPGVRALGARGPQCSRTHACCLSWASHLLLCSGDTEEQGRDQPHAMTRRANSTALRDNQRRIEALFLGAGPRGVPAPPGPLMFVGRWRP
jgi:hypothetical protein